MRRDLEKEVKYLSLLLHSLGHGVGFWPSHISFAWINIFFFRWSVWLEMFCFPANRSLMPLYHLRFIPYTNVFSMCDQKIYEYLVKCIDFTVHEGLDGQCHTL